MDGEGDGVSPGWIKTPCQSPTLPESTPHHVDRRGTSNLTDAQARLAFEDPKQRAGVRQQRKGARLALEDPKQRGAVRQQKKSVYQGSQSAGMYGRARKMYDGLMSELPEPMYSVL